MAGFYMARIWQGSVPGRLTRWYGDVLWEHSVVGRSFKALGRFGARVFNGSVTRRVVTSNWPSGPAFAESRIGQVLLGLNERITRAGQAAAPTIKAAWETSFAGRLARRTADAVGPALATSFLFHTFTGYAGDVTLAPAETRAADRALSPLLPILGFVLGWLALIPSGGAQSSILSPTTLMMAGVWGTFALWLMQKLLRADFTLRFTSAFLPIGVMLFVFAISTFQSANRATSVRNYLIWLTAIMLFVLMVNLVRTSRDAAAFLGPILAATILMGLWAVYQYKFPPVITEGWVDPAEGTLVRVFAGFDNPNYLAEFMALFLPLGVALWLQQPKWRLILMVPLGAMALALLLSQSRGGWAAAALGLAVLAMLRFGRYNLLLVVGVLLLLPLVPNSIVARFMSSFNPENTSNKYRVSIKAGVWNMIRDVWPFGTGLGSEAFVRVYHVYMLPGAPAVHAHNTFLQMFAESGILGLGATLWSLWAVLRRTFTVAADARNAALIAAVPAGMLALLLHGMVDHIWYNPKLLFAFWAVAGLGMGLAIGNREGAAA